MYACEYTLKTIIENSKIPNTLHNKFLSAKIQGVYSVRGTALLTQEVTKQKLYIRYIIYIKNIKSVVGY